MRFVAAAVVGVLACGPSAAEIRHAQDATYVGNPKRVLQAAMEAANALYGIGAVDLEHYQFVTKSFRKSAAMAHRGWAGEWARGAWAVEVHTTNTGRSFVVIRPLAQRSLTVCRRCAPSWIDVAPDDVGLSPDLELGREKLALAIHERASKLQR